MKFKADHEKYYSKNLKYSKHLESQNVDIFRKYINTIVKIIPEEGKILDCGCGTGTAISMLPKGVKAFGIEISETSIKKCKSKNLNCKLYDGKTIPYKDKEFDIVGSIDVLEHTNDPENFLNEQLRVLKNGGLLIVVCPNFLSLTNSYHHHTAGINQKIKNLLSILRKFLSNKYNFEKMETINREDFHPDDDACNVTNPIDIILWAKANSLQTKYWSGRTIDSIGISNVIDMPIFRVFLGSSFFVFKK